MLINLRIRLTTRFVADQRVPAPVDNEEWKLFRKFSSQPDELHPLNMMQWQRAVRTAIEDLELREIDESIILFPIKIKKPRYVVFSRRFNHDGNRRNDQEEWFESIDPKNILTVPTFIHNSSDEALRAPTLPEFERIMTYVGQHIGLSPFGNHFGYGRFTIHSILPANAENDSASVERQPPASLPGDARGGENSHLHAQDDSEAGEGASPRGEKVT